MLTIERFTVNPLQQNSYVLYHESGEAFLIDPGFYTPAEQQELLRFLERKNLTPSKILLTHAHLDHVFGVPFLANHFQLPVYLHNDEKPVYQAANQVGLMYGLPFPELPKGTKELHANSDILLGSDTIHTLFTPGHSPGSVCFHLPAQEKIISGDVLFQQSIGRTDLPGGNHETLIRSIEQELLVLPDATEVYSGHGPVTTIGSEKMNNPFLR
jgi:hydroxyacylglutathione hydrolase